MASGSEKRVGLLHQQRDVLAGGEDNHHPPALANVGLGTDENCETGQAIADSCQALTGIAQMVKCLLSCLIKAPALNQPLTNNLLLPQVCGPSAPTPAQPASRHSPPTSRAPRSNSPKPPLEGLGGLAEAWASPKHWDEFVLWLKSQSEGDDPDGVPKLLSRW